MDMADFFKLFAGASPSGLTVGGLVIAILFLGSRGVWYYGSVHRDVIKDRDDWKAIAVSATATVKDQAVQIEKLTETISHAIGTTRRH
jgi:hypothetical protein